MKVTYIGHSGFMVETAKANFLFDYFRGEMPVVDKDKFFFVFVSHKHPDHFNPTIFQLANIYPKVLFVLSYDIKIKPEQLQKWQLPESFAQRIKIVRADEDDNMGWLRLRTLKSTDSGVAYLLDTDEGRIYHGGDLNWWGWEGEDKQSARNMEVNYKREIDKMTGMSLDAAFVPLDPRQEQSYDRGLNYLLEKTQIRCLFPMHTWAQYEVIDRLLAEHPEVGEKTEVMRIREEGQSFWC